MQKIDWFKIISDLQRNKISMSRLSKELKVSERTIANWKGVTEPKFSAGLTLVELWKKTTNKNQLPQRKGGGNR